MSEQVDSLTEKLVSRAAEADAMIAALRRQIAEVKGVKLARAMALFTAENTELAAQVETLKSRLTRVEIENGLKQMSTVVQGGPRSPTFQNDDQLALNVKAESLKTKKIENGDAPFNSKEEGHKQKPKNTGKKSPSTASKSTDEPEVVDIGRLDLRVGLIVSAEKHPDADSLYVEQVDVGEEKPRTVVSGLVRFISLNEMQNRPAILLCNLKPAKMRGVVSEAMVMCASTPDKVEVLRPPCGSRPGQRIACSGFDMTKPDKELNPKKKVFDRVAPDLKTNEDRIATYKGVPWTVEGVADGGYIVADSLANVNIK